MAWELGVEPTVLRVRVEDGTPVKVYESIPWPADKAPSAHFETTILDVALPSDSTVGRALRKSAFVQTAHEVREHLYALMPYWRVCGDTTAEVEGNTLVSEAGALFELLLRPLRPGDPVEDRRPLYSTALRRGSREQRRLVLAQLVRDAVYLDRGAFQEIDRLYRMVDDPGEEKLLATARVLRDAAGDAHTSTEMAFALEDRLEKAHLLAIVKALIGIAPG